MYNFSLNSHRGNYTVSFTDTDIDLSKWSKEAFIIVDSNINVLYPQLTNYLDTKNIIIVEANEKNKTLSYCQELISLLIGKGIKKNHKLIAIGGGIIQDITGFIASVLFRGIDWIFYPTTLLAQSDSCIGSKTSLNFKNTKNSIGTFYPPKEIICCVKFLNTLKMSEIKSGIGEMLHYYIYDGSIKALDLKKEYEHLLINRSCLMPFIKESLRIKKILVEVDEFDSNQRKLFNYGHTFGHAIEALSDYKINHGQSVTLGMNLANFISWKLGFLTYDKFLYIEKMLFKNMPKYTITENKINDYIKYLSKDKKNENDTIVCILASDFGKLFIHKINDKMILKNLILEYFKGKK